MAQPGPSRKRPRPSDAEDETYHQSSPEKERKKRRRKKKRTVSVTVRDSSGPHVKQGTKLMPSLVSSTITLPEPAEHNVTELAKEIQSKTLLIQKHDAMLTQVQQSMTCQICLDLLYQPFALAPCGHIACYGCLVQWFKTPSRQKTCPHCRTVVSQRPVEVWAIKDLVSGLAKSGLLNGLPATNLPPAANASTDLWAGIFRKPLDLSQQRNVAHEEFSIEDIGMHDTEDGVYRCLDDGHEIWEGRCSSCAREYPGHALLEAGNLADFLGLGDGGWSDDEDMDEDDVDFIADFDEGPDFRNLLLNMAHGQSFDDSDSDSEIVEEHLHDDVIELEDSDDEVPQVVRRRVRPSTIVVSEEEEEDSDSPMIARPLVHGEDEDDEEIEDDDDDEPHLSYYSGRNHEEMEEEPDDDDEETESGNDSWNVGQYY
ncbi:hypothetical protein C8J56DRAFT_436286 [Mycena floridula]|nr:hypothetical protein C8J56DRAFT_436286 [Mycena floridula]